MNKIAFGFFGLTVLALISGFVLSQFVQKVGPHQIGVRTQQFAILGKQGVVEQDYDSPGWYRNLWFVDRWELFDKTVHTLRMTGDGSRDPLRIKSKDGYDVTVHVRVKYHIKPGEAWQLLKTLGPSRQRYENLVLNEAIDACRIEFGEMDTEEFYNPDKRESSAEEIKTRLQAKLDERHLEVIDILISSVIFDPQYEQKIRDKKLADQDVEVNKSRAEAAKYKGITLKVKAETEAMLKTLDAGLGKTVAELTGANNVEIAQIVEEANAYAVGKRAEADLLLQKARAKADLLIKSAEAEGEKARTSAMAGPGGRALVALEAARNLNIGEVEVSTLGIDVLDVEKMAVRLGAER